MIRAVAGAVVLAFLLAAPASGARAPFSAPVRTLSGAGNNVAHRDWGKAGTPYVRDAAPAYSDGLSAIPAGPSPRLISNRIFDDLDQNLFSENGVTQWGWAWGQFIDHDFGLEQQEPKQIDPIPFDLKDPLERFLANDLLQIDFWRTPPAAGTGETTPRQHRNELSSYIDASNVYGVNATRLSWLRQGARLLLTPAGYLPRADARGDAATAPAMELEGPLRGRPAKAVEAGDVRANENTALTAIQTLFAREHNRIVGRLPASLPAETRFQIARRVVGAEVQYVTYHEFLPALGVRLAPYRGYRPGVNATLSNEFAVVGYRAHSMVNGSLEVTEADGTWPAATLAAFTTSGIAVHRHEGLVTLSIPLGLAVGNPDLLEAVGEKAILEALGSEREYRNDEQIDEALRSILFLVPVIGTPPPEGCQGQAIKPACFNRIDDLGAIDIARGRDHGVPAYNALRAAYGLPGKAAFEDITGEPGSPAVALNDRTMLDFVALRDEHGNPVPLGDQVHAVTGVRRTTLAARLRAVYGDVGRLDALVGMLAEPHVAGSEFGELQLAMWKRQFQRLRDGDRFFYENDPALREIQQRYGVSYRHTLADLIRLDGGARARRDVFRLPQ
jgi:hypothetical protein